MSINSTQQEQDTAAATDLATKLALEATVVPDLRRLFESLGEQAEASIALTNTLPPIDHFEAFLKAILFTHYTNVKNRFENNLIVPLEKEPSTSSIWAALFLMGAAKNLTTKPQILNYFQAAINRLTVLFVIDSVLNDSKYITATTVDELAAAYTAAYSQLDKELGRPPTKEELAPLTKQIFLTHSLTRVEMIAVTTTQKGAEGTKQISRDIYLSFRNNNDSGLEELPLTFSDTQEIWRAVGDSVTRLAHLIADGQVKENGFFVVKGQFLRYPGDTSLGATADNVINCRCSALFSIDELEM